jgi:hypothetical protein
MPDPIRAPIRTKAERLLGSAFTAAELATIEQAVAAGRVARIPRGRCAWPEQPVRTVATSNLGQGGDRRSAAFRVRQLAA